MHLSFIVACVPQLAANLSNFDLYLFTERMETKGALSASDAYSRLRNFKEEKIYAYCQLTGCKADRKLNTALKIMLAVEFFERQV